MFGSSIKKVHFQINRLRKDGHLCSWELNSNQKAAFIYVFSINTYPNLNLNQNTYKSIGKRKIDESLPFKIRLVLIKAIAYQIEFSLLKQNIIKIGDWFTPVKHDT